MSEVQKGVIAEPNLHAINLFLNVIDDDIAAIRTKLAQCLELFEDYEREYYEAMVTGLVAVGQGFWLDCYGYPMPSELHAFPDLQVEDRSAPSSPVDLLLIIRADRLDTCYELAKQLYDLFGQQVELVDQVTTLRYLDGREITGFQMCQENPRGQERLDIASVSEQDPNFIGGSYVHTQRFRLDLARWNTLSERQQEQIIGRSKRYNLPLEERSMGSHDFRLSAAFPHATHYGLINQSMPFADVREQGLLFVSCAHSSRAFRDLIHSRYYGDANGNYDLLLDYMIAETGGAFFAPSVQFIQQAILEPADSVTDTDN